MPFIEFQGQARALGPGVLTVGSAPGAGWRITGRGLDPMHLMLSVEPGGHALLIRGSSSSTVLINGTELAPLRTMLSFGDRIAVGPAEFQYLRLAPGAGAATGYLHDVRRGRVYQLRERTSIGRDLSSTIIIHEPDVSRLHAELVHEGDAFRVVPHGVSVTSVNGARLSTPTALQEGDQIAVGRTVLRFTTALPSSSAVSRDPVNAPNRAPAALARDARAQTTFIGTIEAQEQRTRATRRRLARAASIALVAVAAVAVIVSLYADAHQGPVHSPRSQLHATRRGTPESSPATASGELRTGRAKGARLPSGPAPQ